LGHGVESVPVAIDAYKSLYFSSSCSLDIDGSVGIEVVWLYLLPNEI